MENFDYFIYYVQEDILVCYSFEDNSLREDTIYGFEYCASNLSTNPYFWDFDWDHCDYCRHRVLYSNYTLEEFKENIVESCCLVKNSMNI